MSITFEQMQKALCYSLVQLPKTFAPFPYFLYIIGLVLAVQYLQLMPSSVLSAFQLFYVPGLHQLVQDNLPFQHDLNITSTIKNMIARMNTQIKENNICKNSLNKKEHFYEVLAGFSLAILVNFIKSACDFIVSIGYFTSAVAFTSFNSENEITDLVSTPHIISYL